MDKENTNKTTTAQLIDRFQNGDQYAFNQLIQRYGADVFSFIFRMVKDPVVAEDVYQETWSKVLHHFKNYREQDQFKCWLFKIANNLCLNQVRILRRIFISVSKIIDSNTNSYFVKIVDNSPQPDIEFENREALELIQKSVQSLPVKQRQVFLLRINGELPFKEIAEILNKPLNTVLGQMRTALLTIKKDVQEIYGEV